MTHLVVTVVRLWVRIYTIGLEISERERIRAEIEADLWEQINSEATQSRPIPDAVIIFLRFLLGIPSDIQRMAEGPGLRGLSIGTRKVLGAVVEGKLWLSFLVVLGVSLSFMFLVITPIIMAIINRL
jgi:hypothetical protein